MPILKKPDCIDLFGKEVLIDDSISDCFESPTDGSITELVSDDNQKHNLIYGTIPNIMKEKGFSNDDLFATKLALDEIYTNAIEHADTDKVPINYLITDEYAQFTVRSKPTDFDPNKIPDPREDKNLTKKRGRGLLLTVQYMDQVYFDTDYSCVRCVRRKGGDVVKGI